MSRPLTVYEGDLLLLKRQAAERDFGARDERKRMAIRHGFLLALEEVAGIAIPQAESDKMRTESAPATVCAAPGHGPHLIGGGGG